MICEYTKKYVEFVADRKMKLLNFTQTGAALFPWEAAQQSLKVKPTPEAPPRFQGAKMMRERPLAQSLADEQKPFGKCHHSGVQSRIISSHMPAPTATAASGVECSSVSVDIRTVRLWVC